ncbi:MULTISPECIES: ABC transporter ATP-binding protein [Mycolicibacterium]|uniref:ABC transporter n=1 Tax=Mycolicibacterium senegalense TaxID=1796 RepID=A0A378W7I6_9MYCO|nr:MULTISPECIES: ABC transporter ATP-binding protein [Mycolicibacterium]MCV7333721.1 ABC transporter ATP-binding protein [Mycolicibacterium senegalense]MDR7288196.1 NitT/TauT family transport system ATP-binding protein [Mycolicibacterium senegalense]QZA25166.1 ABC transporter ATP-binding protein [Mycolicibacterium senegalense]CDP85954.1 transporter ATPase [Mycolicibacterium farcinogenes]SUA28228.1 ABC transporter [Mycolicibacterium senegalense]
MSIQTRDLVVKFPGKQEPTLKGISLTIPDGSFYVLVGASGSGKSTLLHCLAGLITATSGSITDNGEDVTAPNPRRGVAFQRDVLFPWMTVADNIDFALAARRSAKSQRRATIHELLDLVGLRDEVARQRPGELSGGMRQRVSIARVLAGEPTVMLMDEPFAALDALTRLRMQDLLIDLWTRLNRTIVFVTHDIDEAIRLGDTVSVLRDGKIADQITNPLSRPRPADSLADQPGYSEIRKSLHHQLGIDHAVH